MELRQVNKLLKARQELRDMDGAIHISHMGQIRFKYLTAEEMSYRAVWRGSLRLR